MSDGELRSRFQVQTAVAALKRAPLGTTVHLIDPWSWSDPSGISHRLPQGLDALPQAFGGASYSVAVNREEKGGTILGTLVRRVVFPDRFESLALRDLHGTEWPDLSEAGATSDTEISPGETEVWEGIASEPLPAPLTLRGWVWSAKHDLALGPDPALERILPRLATAEAGQSLACDVSQRLQDRAQHDGFLAPGLALWIGGSGEFDDGVVYAPSEYDCVDGTGGGGPSRAPTASDLLPEFRSAFASCGMAAGKKGALHVAVEVQDQEILDVQVKGGTEDARRCVEEALWALSLRDDFNEAIASRVDYAFTLVPAPR
jgi:hypothetical protein